MLTHLTIDALKLRILDILRHDDRTYGHLSEVSDAIVIMQRVLPGDTNWTLGDWAPFKRLSPDLKAALLEAEIEAQTLFRLQTPPLGSSAISAV
ncbi:hypothetical protein [Acidovorax sp. LjRoot117]|uniref:hypothetical protein n=1 Tax=Acidovorax sp. LjRoot117 TaxID=3342255 RepID=UPI003ECDCE45